MLFLGFLSALLFSLVHHTNAQIQEITSAPYDPSPFQITGAITAMTLDAGTDRLRGGTIKIDGITVVIPANTLANLPAAVVA
jgi:hypothetical protein